MILRPLKDKKELRELYNKYYSSDFEYADEFMCSFVIEEEGKVLVAGGIRLVPEVILYVNKAENRFKLGRAFLESLKASINLMRYVGFDRITAVTSNKKWKRHLVRWGFVEKGVHLYLGIH